MKPVSVSTQRWLMKNGFEFGAALSRSQGADEDATVTVQALHPDPISQEGASRERAGGVHRDDADGMAGFSRAAGEGGGDRAFADPWRAGDADPDGPLLPGVQPVTDLRDEFRMVFNLGDHPGTGLPASAKKIGPELRLDRPAGFSRRK